MADAYDEDAAFERVMQACRAAEAKGWKVVPGSFLRREHGEMRCCPIGAFLVEAEETVPLPEGVSTFQEQLRMFRLWRKETHIGVMAKPSSFAAVIDGVVPMSPAHSRTRAARLARRVRAALWSDGAA